MSCKLNHIRTWSLAAVLLAAVGCVDEKTVYVKEPLWEEPPAVAAKFLGYSDEASKQTTCGNCHAGQQKAWTATAHADAAKTLVASGHAQTFCEGCHNVSPAGNNAQVEKAGWTATADKRYGDVQCESCHGPGLDHVNNPSAIKPLASINTDTAMANGCGGCHNDTHHPYVEEWRQSIHGSGRELSHTGDNASCNYCHTAEDALRSWGVTSNYAEKEGLAAAGKHQAISCAVCHDPHSKNHPGQLRFAVDAPNEEENLCMKCHHKRGVPDPASSRGPHSPEGPMLIGTGGWWPPSMPVAQGSIIATHGTEANPKLCAGCHMNRFTVNDAAGQFAYQVTGHTFEAIPCLDASGMPTHGPCELTQRSFKACTASGCHGTETAARSAMIASEMRIKALGDALAVLIPKIPATEFKTGDNRITTGEGAKFNLEFATVKTGNIIHNPFLVEALLTATIKQVKLDYGLSAPASLNLNNVLSAN